MDYETLIEEMKKTGRRLVWLAESLEAMRKADAEHAPEERRKDTAEPRTEAPAKVAPPKHAFEEIRGLLARKAAGGFRDKVKELLEAHGMGCLSDMADKPELYEMLYAEAERIGAVGNHEPGTENAASAYGDGKRL